MMDSKFGPAKTFGRLINAVRIKVCRGTHRPRRSGRIAEGPRELARWLLRS